MQKRVGQIALGNPTRTKQNEKKTFFFYPFFFFLTADSLSKNELNHNLIYVRAIYYQDLRSLKSNKNKGGVSAILVIASKKLEIPAAGERTVIATPVNYRDPAF